MRRIGVKSTLLRCETLSGLRESGEALGRLVRLRGRKEGVVLSGLRLGSEALNLLRLRSEALSKALDLVRLRKSGEALRSEALDLLRSSKALSETLGRLRRRKSGEALRLLRGESLSETLSGMRLRRRSEPLGRLRGSEPLSETLGKTLGRLRSSEPLSKALGSLRRSGETLGSLLRCRRIVQDGDGRVTELLGSVRSEGGRNQRHTAVVSGVSGVARRLYKFLKIT